MGANTRVDISGTHGAFDLINATGDAAGGTTATGSPTGIYFAPDAEANVLGSANYIALTGTDDTLGAYGGANTIQAIAGDAVVIGSTGANFDTVNATNDAGGGTTSTGNATGIALLGHSAVNLIGSGNSVTLTGADDTLGAYGGGNVIQTIAGDAIVIGSTNGNFDTVNATNDASGGTTSTGNGTGIFLNDDAQVNLIGSGNSVGLGTGDSLGAYGGGNTVNIHARDFVVLGQTESAADTVIGSGDVAGGLTDNGQQGTGIYLNSGAQANVTGDNDYVSGADNTSVGVFGTNNTIELGNNSATNVQNTGSGIDTVMLNGINAYAGLLGGSGYRVNGSNGTVATWDNTQFNVTGNGDQINAAGNTSGRITGTNDILNLGANARFNVQNTGSGNDTVTFNGTGDYVGLLGGAGYRVNGSNGSVATWDNTQFNVTGDSDQIDAGGNTSGRITGTNDILNLGANARFNVQNTGSGSDTVTFGGTGDYVGLLGGAGYRVNGSNGSVATWDNTQFNVTGDSDQIGAGGNTSGRVTGTNDILNLGVDARFNVQNTGSGSDRVTFGGTGDYVGLLGGIGYQVNGSNGSVATWANTQFNVIGNSNTVDVTTGDVAGVLGGGNTVNAAANTEIGIGDTNGTFDTINANGDVAGGTDVLGVPTGIYLAKNAQANLFGSNNTIGLDTGDSFGAYGGGNEIDGTSGDFVVVGQTNGVYDNIYGSNDLSGGTSDNGKLGTGIVVMEDAQASLIGSNNSVNLGTGGTLGLVSGTGNTVNGSGATINALSGVGATINGYSNTLVATGTADAFNLSGGADSVTLGGGSAVRLLDGSGYQITGSNDLFGANGNTSFNIAGNSNNVTLASGDTLAILGGGNTITADARTAIFVGGTNDSPDAIHINGNQAGGVTADGREVGIALLSGSQANVIGDNNTITVGQDSGLGAFGNGNQVLSGINGNVAINGKNNNVVSIAGGQDIFVGTGNSATVNGTAVYPVDGNYVAVTGTPSNAMAFQAAIAGSPQIADDIDEVYLEVLGRGVDPSGLTGAQSLLAAGGTLADLRTSTAGSPEAFSDMRATFAAIGVSDGPTSTELAGFKAQMSASYDAPITLIGHDGVLASTSATNLLAELPVLETLNNGRTLSLRLADGSNLSFTDTARLADFLYAIAVQKSQADTFVTDTYYEDIKWLDQVDQPMLNVAENLEDLAAYNTSVGKTDQATLSNAASRIALQIAAEAPGTRGQISEKVNLPGHVNQVTVFADTHDPYGGATYHDIDPGIGGILETVGVAVITLAAVLSGQPELYYVAVAVDAAEAGKDFANGDILGGILQLASAAGSFEIGLGGANALNSATQTGKIILTAAQGVGGVYGAVQSAQNGDALGVIAGVLEATAAVASGIAGPTTGGNPFEGPGIGPSQIDVNGNVIPSINEIAGTVAKYLNIGSVAVSTSDAFKEGNIASGLLSSLHAVFENIGSDYAIDQAEGLSYEDDAFEAAGADFQQDYQNLQQSDGRYLIADMSNALPGAARLGYQMGIASSQDDNAKFTFPDDTRSYKPTYIKSPDGSTVTGNLNLYGLTPENTKAPIVFPEQLSPTFIADRAAHDKIAFSDVYAPAFKAIDAMGSSTDPIIVQQRLAIEAQLYLTTPLGYFKEDGIWDAQRFQTPDAPKDVYTPAASFLIGMYGAGVGASEKVIDQINQDFFSLKGAYRPIPTQPMASPIYPSVPANMKSKLRVSNWTNSACECFFKVFTAIDISAPSIMVSNACCTPTPLTSRTMLIDF